MVTLVILFSMNLYIALSIDINIIISFLCWKTMVLPEYKKKVIKSSIKISLIVQIITTILILFDGTSAVVLGELQLTYIIALILIELILIHSNYTIFCDDMLTDGFFRGHK